MGPEFPNRFHAADQQRLQMSLGNKQKFLSQNDFRGNIQVASSLLDLHPVVLILRLLMSAFSSLFPSPVWSETWHRKNRTLEREGKGEGMWLSNRTHTPLAAHTLKAAGAGLHLRQSSRTQSVEQKPPLHHLSPAESRKRELEGKEGGEIKLHIPDIF